jgi:hypothetical protein
MRASWLGLVVLAFGAGIARAQDTAIVIHPDSTALRVDEHDLPRIVADEVIRLYNATTTTRLVGRSRLPLGNSWHGDVAVRNGPALIAGRVEGTLLVINGDAVLDGNAEITGNLIVVGGVATVPADARVDGEVRQYREPLPYRLAGESIEYAPNLRSRLRNLGVQRTWATADSRSSLTIATGGTFNRVEGLPIVFGPLFDWRLRSNARVRIDALGVLRSAGDLSDARSDLGYMVRSEVRLGETRGVAGGVRAYDVVAAVEDWGLRPAEVGWEAFLFHRDYRDYYLTKGIAGYIIVQPERPLQLSVEVRRDWQTSVEARDPWTLFRNDHVWRGNPPIDDGHYVTVTGSASLDTRNDTRDPSSGWFLRGWFETSRSRDVTPQTTVPADVRDPIPTDGSYRYNRLFIDARRYTRVSPSGRLNLRVVAGGKLGGDPLPLQRRLSLGGPDPMAGYSFRASSCNATFVGPTFLGTQVAACDRVLAVQVEYRGHLSLNWSYNPSRGDDRPPLTQLWLEGLDLVVFGSAGQAWLVGPGPGRFPADAIPPIGDWLADLGLGIDWGGFGAYVAKAVSPGERTRLTLRLDHRF